MLTRKKFIKRYYQLDKINKVLYVYETSETHCKLKQTYDLTDADIQVDDKLEGSLKDGYERELK